MTLLQTRYSNFIERLNRPDSFSDGSSAPPERWMQQIWRHQRLRRTGLRTLDGKPLEILHPGFWNREAGPDFRQAVIRWNGESAQRGDIEIDREIGGWKGHGHRENPAYQRVILHVVWESPTRDLRPPVLPLKPHLDAPLQELAQWINEGDAEPSPESMRGKCHGPLRQLSASDAMKLIQEAAITRLRQKAAVVRSRAKQAGWDQALWEHLMIGLGYKHNPWPMRRLAEMLQWRPKEVDSWPSESVVEFETARLFGVAGLLSQWPSKSSGTVDPYWSRLWDHWWRERSEWSESILPKTLWRRSGVRPANHPQRRLALAAEWRAAGDLPQRIERWFLGLGEARDGLIQLHRCFRPLAVSEWKSHDEFWSRSWTLGGAKLNQPRQLLGFVRTTDLAINAVLPWLWARAESVSSGSPSSTKEAIERCYLEWPSGEDNAVLRLVRERLFAGKPPKLPRRASTQQGLLQIVRDFCEHTDATCERCQFPELVLHQGALSANDCHAEMAAPVHPAAPLN